MNVLLFGFSVTADKTGYAVKVKEYLTAKGHEVDICGIGGIHPFDAVYLADDLFSRKRYDIICLDILTSSFRRWAASKEEIICPLLYLIEAAARTGAKPVILDFFRTDVDYRSDLASEAVLRMALYLGFDIARIAQEVAGSDLKDKIMLDYVHVDQNGTKHYTERVLAAIERAASNSPVDKAKLVFSGGEYAVSPLPVASQAQIETFERAGHEVTYASLGAAIMADVTFGKQVRIHGFGCVVGPRTSALIIENGDKTTSVRTFDKNCYYRRYAAKPIEPVVVSSIRLRCDPKPANVKLLKGTPDAGMRTIDFVHFFIALRSNHKQFERLRQTPTYAKAVA